MSSTAYEDIIKFVASNLKCSICLELFTEPVTLSCGHTYCHRCIKAHLVRGKKNCPDCRSVLKTLPGLKKNVTLSNILDLQEAGGRDVWNQITNRTEQCYSNNTTVTTDGCTEDDQTDLMEDSVMSSQPPEPENSLNGLSQVDQSEDILPADGEENPDVLLENPNTSGSSGSASALQINNESAEFVSLSFSPALGHRRLVFLPERRRMEVRSRGSLLTQQGRFEACQWMADQEFSSGRFYWDVEVSQCSGWAAGLGYSDLPRDHKLGRTSSSWCVERTRNRLSSWHAGTETPLDLDRLSSLRVLLDMDAGHLTFWSLTDVRVELHRFQADFRGPVRPVFWLFGTLQGNALSFPAPC